MTYALFLLVAGALLCAAALHVAGAGGLKGDSRVGFAAAFGTLMSVAAGLAAWLAGVGAAVPLLDRLVGYALIGSALVVLVALFEFAAARLRPARGAGWLVAAMAAIIASVEAVMIVWQGPTLWSLVDFGFVGALAAIAWWAALPPAGTANGVPLHG